MCGKQCRPCLDVTPLDTKPLKLIEIFVAQMLMRSQVKLARRFTVVLTSHTAYLFILFYFCEVAKFAINCVSN